MISVILILGFSNQLRAEAMDIKTHGVLIEKLEQGNKVQQNAKINLRLADLYSDRSRLKQISEMEQKCENCLSSIEDRKKSVELYHSTFNQLDPKEQERVFEQISDSSIRLGQDKKAQNFYEQVLKDKKYSHKLKAMAHLSLARTYFFSQQYKKAYSEFNTSKKMDSSLQTTSTKYQMAWCEFNMGQYDLAKKHLEILLAERTNIDASLRVDISRDFAKFTAKGPINNKEIKKIHELSPETEAKVNIEHLASELDRLDRAPENLQVNRYLLEYFATKPSDKAIAYLSMAQAELTLKRLNQVPLTFDKSIENYKKVDCDDEAICPEYQKKAKMFLVYWNKVEKDGPSVQLNNVWQSYLQIFNKEADMQFLAAQSFHKTKNFSLAVNHYIVASTLIKKEEKSQHIQLFAVSLDASMAAAEESKSILLKRKAYENYLLLNPEGPQSLEVKYQLAYLNYEEKKLDQAINGFNNIIEEFQKNKSSKNKKVAKQSADLILDIYAVKKDNGNIMIRSLGFVVTFPENKKEFNGIYRKALINEALLSFNQKDNAKQVEILNKLTALSFRDVAKEEQVIILETRVRLAQATQNLDEVKRSSSNLISFKDLNKKIKDFAYDKMIWASEMTLDFNKAYTFTKMSYPSKKWNKNQLLKLALLSEVSGQNPNRYYELLLDHSGGTLEKNQIRAKIIQNSGQPWTEIKNKLQKLKGSPQLLSELTLETYGRYPNRKSAELVLSIPNVKNKPAALILRRQLEIPHFVDLEKKLSKHIISHRSESLSQKGITQRLDLIKKMENFANESIKRKDFVLQSSALYVLKVEKERLARDLTNLPLPKSLNANEKVQYQSILSSKVASINAEAKKIELNLNEAWKNSKYLETTQVYFNNSHSFVQKLLVQETHFFSQYAPKSVASDLSAFKVKQPISNQEIQLARQKVMNKPFDASPIKSLRDMERVNDNGTYVAYLDKRLAELNKRITP